MSERIKLITDTASSITQPEAQHLGIGLIPFHIHFSSGDCFTDFTLSPSELYLRQKTEHAKTATPNPEELKQLYQNYYQQGFRQFITICISSSLSGAFQNANFVSQEFLTEHSDTTIKNIDSASLCVGQGLSVNLAWELINQGKSIEKIVEKLNQAKNNTVLFSSGSPETPRFVLTSGRPKIDPDRKSLLNSVLKIVPLLHTTSEGEVKLSGFTRGDKNGRKELVNMLIEEIKRRGNILPSVIGVGYTRDQQIGEELMESIYSSLPQIRRVALIGPKEAGSVLATHTGPGVSVIAASWY